MRETTYQLLTEEDKKLIDAAESALETAYNPYSHFAVGTAVLTEDQQIITGSNVENAAYGSTICAERAAILRANAMGYRNFEKIAIIGKYRNEKTEEITTPCGCCRQVISEFAVLSGKNIEIIMANTKKDKIVIACIDELLPLAFS